MATSETNKTCIIVGGGIAGCAVAKNLKSHPINVTIVDKNDYLDWSLASGRMLANPDVIEKKSFLMPLDKIAQFYGANFVHSGVVSVNVDDGKKCVVKLANGETLEGDCIVLSTGGCYEGAGNIWKPTADQTTREARIRAFREENARAAAVESIAVVGAGLTGVEIAGELRNAFPNKEITLVGSLLPSVSASARRRTQTKLSKMGVKLVDGRIENDAAPSDDGKITTSLGETISAHLIYHAVGFAFQVGNLLSGEELRTSIAQDGRLDCKETLQLKSCEHIFACGDIVHVPEGKYPDIKGSVQADQMANTVAANVVALLSNKTLPSIHKWSNAPVHTPVMTVLGPKIGIGSMGMPRIMSWIEDSICRKVKCDDYFLSIKAKEFGKGETW